MAARGRKPQGNYKHKTQVFSTRITADLREALETAAKTSGHSISQEVEHRLRRSFLNDREITSVFGNRRNYAVLKMISALMEIMRPAVPWSFSGVDSDAAAGTDPQKDWLDDPYAFDQLLKAVSGVMEELRPLGPPVAPLSNNPIENFANETEGSRRAADLLFAIKDAPTELPLDSRSPAPLIRADLGAVALRIGAQPGTRLVRGGADDLRKAAEELEQEEEGAKRQ
jgi:hypothetical protein